MPFTRINDVTPLNILVRVPNWVGDSVMSLPFFDALHLAFPDSRVDIIAKDTVHDIFRYHPAISMIHSFSKTKTKGLHRLFRYGRALQRETAFDVFFTLAPSFSSSVIGLGTGCRSRIGYAGDGRSLLLTHSPRPVPGKHRVEAYCRLLDCLAEPHLFKQNAEKTVRIVFSQSEQQERMLPLSPGMWQIVLNVNSEAPSRRLPLETWTGLGRKLLAEAPQPVNLNFIGTAAEGEHVHQVMREIASPDRTLDFTGKTSLLELALFLRDADLVISNDSGPMHLANAVGTPVITFFGAGNPAETSPFNRENAVVINKHLPCSPCVKNICKFKIVRCLEQISVDEIYQNVVSILNKSAGHKSLT
jgi:heptosyltransferase II